MRRPIPKRKVLVAGFAIALLAAPLVLSMAVRSAGTTAQASGADSQTVSSTTSGPIVTSPVAVGESKPLRDLPASRSASTKPPTYRLGESESLLQRRSLRRRAAGHERRRRAEPLRANGQHGLHDLLEDG